MTSPSPLKLLLVSALLSAIPFRHSCGQIVTSLNNPADTSGKSVVSHLNKSYIEDSDYAAENIILDWNSVYESFSANKETIRKLDSLDARIDRLQLLADKSLPHLYNENGIDLFLLSTEGIVIYSVLDKPAFLIDISSEVIRWIRIYALDKRKYTSRMLERFSKWESRLTSHFSSLGIPPELSALCLVESGCTYSAVSTAGAAGMWQIMPETGRKLGLKVTPEIDDRFDPLKASYAAARLLLSNYRNLGDWTLAAAAYNCGTARVQTAVKRVGTKKWEKVSSLLPSETKHYIPRLLALHYVWTYRKELGF